MESHDTRGLKLTDHAERKRLLPPHSPASSRYHRWRESTKQPFPRLLRREDRQREGIQAMAAGSKEILEEATIPRRLRNWGNRKYACKAQPYGRSNASMRALEHWRSAGKIVGCFIVHYISDTATHGAQSLNLIHLFMSLDMLLNI